MADKRLGLKRGVTPIDKRLYVLRSIHSASPKAKGGPEDRLLLVCMFRYPARDAMVSLAGADRVLGGCQQYPLAMDAERLSRIHHRRCVRLPCYGGNPIGIRAPKGTEP